MSDEPSLPSLPPSISWNAQTERFSNKPNNPKKRRYDLKSHSAAPPSWSNSSDPAVFSSDDDPGLDNYVEGRRKKRYVGSWYQQQPAASSDSATGEPRPALRGKRAFKRDMDSGVWMGSDSTDGDDTMMPELPTQARLPQLNLAPAPVRRNVVSSEEVEAREKIQRFVDAGEEKIDLSMMGLKSLSDATVRILSEFSCIPVVAEGVPFEHKDPSLELYLYRNPLLRLPGAIFDLEHLTVLSLRGCRLRELPPAIGKMRKLKTLNLAQNLLRYLPAELLDLMAAPSSLVELLLQGNHFFQNADLPRLSDMDNLTAEDPEGKTLLEAWREGFSGTAGRFFARSPVHYLDTSGFPHSDFRLDPEAVMVPIDRPEGDGASLVTPPSSAPYHSKSAGRSVMSSQGSRVPSLMELALRSAYKSSNLDELPDYIPEMPKLQGLLERAADQKEVGGQACCACKKPFVAPTVQWLEWWQVCLVESRQREGNHFLRSRPWTDLLEENDGAVPFLRRGCSWKCGPAEIREGQWSIRPVEDAAQEGVAVSHLAWFQCGT